MSVGAIQIPDTWEEPEGLSDLLADFRVARPSEDVSKIREAYYMAEQAHRGQVRASGEPYVTHPLAVAHILVDLKMDEESIIAALLHDTLEDTGIDKQAIEQAFGGCVASLVEGVTKMRFPPLADDAEWRQAAEKRARVAETMRKMLLAMAKDFRVIVIKLADRLHNMQTLQHLPEDKRVRVAQETMDIYAPLASRLGIWQVKWQLEDLAFKYLHPQEFEDITERLAKTRAKREAELHESIVILKERLEQAGIHEAEVQGRPKHLYSIHQKMAVHGFDFEEIFDLLGIRVLVPEEADCYRVLGLVHELWKPIPGLFFDYIANPKVNGYQSLHTKVVGPHGEPLEVQIRTFDMHGMAEYGIASHWQYKTLAKTKTNLEEVAMINRLRQQIVDWSSETASGSEFLRSVSMDLFGEQVFCFTPKGDAIDLPAGASPIDFAFRIHSQVGLHCAGAKVNGRIVKLDHALENGDIVEVLTRRDAQPSMDWLRIAKTANARSKIRAFFRQQNREANAQRGRDALESEVRSHGQDPKQVMTEERMLEIAKVLRKNDVKSLLASVGDGTIAVKRVVNRLLPTEGQSGRRAHGARVAAGAATLAIGPGGVDNVTFRRGKCCLPVPGDEVVGYISKGRGVILHRKLCPNLAEFAAREPDRIVTVNWPKDSKAAWPVNLRIITMNRQGLLADISAILGETKTNVVSATIRTLPDQTALIDITVDVTDRQHLASLINKVSPMQDVISIQRTFGGKRA